MAPCRPAPAGTPLGWRTVGVGVLAWACRLVATLIGGAIVIAGSLAAERLLPSRVPPAPARPSHRRAGALISGGQE